MLTTARARTSAVALALVTGATAVSTAPASAQDGSGVTCPPWAFDCEIAAEDPAPGNGGTAPAPSPGSGSGGGSGPETCWDDLGQRNGLDEEPVEVPCYLEHQGWWSAQWACYFQIADPQPDDLDAWASNGGHRGDPAEHPEGQAWQVYCPNAWELTQVWLPGPPDDLPGEAVDVEALAERAVELMRLEGPAIGTAPSPEGRGTVGVPVWLWSERSPTTTGPVSQAASAGSVTVTAEATLTRVVWDMGDGTEVTCTSPGTAYTSSHGMAESPDCGHLYSRTGPYAVAPTSTWTVEWTATTGDSGTITTTRTSPAVELTIGEVSAVN
ncbi:hypothetical protein [Streptomyces sp. SM12]|uniref:hypothetical protein n=1 Tax=Streptomyces sp. SM12 TaxID=1071602 RepID=UPI0015E16FE9|nr:hypothetical protein [Streptomyces sp. SM12]